ncbi:PIG-L deacetylase family protein [Pseudomonas putida]
MSRKQQLLKRHRRNKRLALLAGLVVVVLLGVLVKWWLAPLLAVLAWVAHEAWFADHLFYAPGDDYHYNFGDNVVQPAVTLAGGRLRLAEPQPLDGSETLVLALKVKAGWLGRFIDPQVEISAGGQTDRQTFERGVDGLRYLNLSSFGAALAAGELQLRGRHCRLLGEPRLWLWRHPQLRGKRVMVIAPHADDAELAAFGLYRQADTWVVTLTAGEIEAEHYQAMGLPVAEAARLKGRLRAWDSIAVPAWAGVAQERCVQLGYFCLQLPAMQAAPDQAVPSREAQLDDTRLFRQYNRIALPGDDGVPSWNNLLADLRAVIELARPEVLIMPDAAIDPHPDHICSQAAVLEALQGLAWQPHTVLGYANHLHDNDRWPMGDAHTGVSLPPFFDASQVMVPLSLELAPAVQVDKAMALGMMHDLQPAPPFKRQVRRWLQQCLAGRRWPPYGDNEFMRKAVRRHELFWVSSPLRSK